METMKAPKLKEKIPKLFTTDFPKAVRKNKKIIYITTIVFLSLAGLAFSATQLDENPLKDTIETQTKPAREILNEEANVERTQLEWTIFLLKNNLRSTILTIALGLFFGILPLYTLLINGLLIGYVLSLTTLSPLSASAMILPHGVFELTGYILAISCGMKLGIGSIKSLFHRKVEPLKKNFLKITHLIPLSLILITVAGIVEGLLGSKKDQILASPKTEILLIIFSLISLTILILWFSGKLTKTFVQPKP